MIDEAAAFDSIEEMRRVLTCAKCPDGIALRKKAEDARRAAQILIEEIGASGPESVVETATRAAARIRAVALLLERNGCDCECDHCAEEHDDDCDRCLACRIEHALLSSEPGSGR